ncbi:PsiF family protein [Burkholderiaceae bacterium UC74_6]
MKSLITVLAVAALALTGVAAHAKEKTAQQEKMVACNKEATDKKGDERKAFMKTCLSAKPAAAASAAVADSGAAAACDAKAAEKKLHGAAKTSFTKKCVADAK